MYFLADPRKKYSRSIGLVMIILYWAKNNTQFGYLESTDHRHASAAIGQLVLVLGYFFSSDLVTAYPEASIPLNCTPLTWSEESGQSAMINLLRRWSSPNPASESH